MADVFEVQGEGDDELTRFFDLTLLGTLVSLHLAAREGVDPGRCPPSTRRRTGGFVLERAGAGSTWHQRRTSAIVAVDVAPGCADGIS